MGLLQFIIVLIITLVLLTIGYILYKTYIYYNTECPVYYSKISMLDYIISLTSDVCKCDEVPVDEESDTPEKTDEVFHISNQNYTYNQSHCKCNAYGARLAKYEEVINAFNKGANWCSMGWCDSPNGPAALYPIQQQFYDTLSDEDKTRCGGNTGVNGGYFKNSNLRFGVNCYGKRPEGKLLDINNDTLNKNKNKADDFCTAPDNANANAHLTIDRIAPFNKDNWAL
jgi:hypothetical protein